MRLAVDSVEPDSRRVVNCLIALRLGAGLSQVELAKRMRCTQSKVSKMENGTDGRLRVADLFHYARSVGVGVRVRICTECDTERSPHHEPKGELS